MEIITRYTVLHGRPPRFVSVGGQLLTVSAAGLYGLLTSNPAASGMSNAALGRLLGYGPRTIDKALNALEGAGLVAREYTRLSRRINVIEEVTN